MLEEMSDLDSMVMTGSRSTPFGGLNGSDPDQWIGGGRGRDGQRSLVIWCMRRSRGNARPDLMAWSSYGATHANALIGVLAVPAMRSGRTTQIGLILIR